MQPVDVGGEPPSGSSHLPLAVILHRLQAVGLIDTMVLNNVDIMPEKPFAVSKHHSITQHALPNVNYTDHIVMNATAITRSTF
jgi:hypothetical protein